MAGGEGVERRAHEGGRRTEEEGAQGARVRVREGLRVLQTEVARVRAATTQDGPLTMIVIICSYSETVLCELKHLAEMRGFF